jgi:uncharacterized protein (TIGR03435 family)
MKSDPARVEIRCATLPMLIGFAWRHPPDRIQGPDWMTGVSSPRFDIAATLPEGTSKRQVPEMLQTLLAERFQLQLHAGSTAEPVYALVLLRDGPSMQPADAAVADEESGADPIGFYGTIQDRAEGSATIISSPRIGRVKQTDTGDHLHLRWESDGITFEGLAELLDKVAPLSVPIVDMTSRPGRYRLSLAVTMPNRLPPDELEPAVVRAFNDGLRKLGLQLERRRGTVPSLIVDHVEKNPSGN